MNEEKRSPWIFIVLLTSSVLLLGIFIIALLSIIDNPWMDEAPEEQPPIETPVVETPVTSPAPETTTFEGLNDLPKFTYPLGWHIALLATEETTSEYDGFVRVSYGYVNNEPIAQCSGCDMSPGPIHLALYERAGDNDAESLATQLLENLNQPEFYTDLNDVSTELPNGRYTEITLNTTENSFGGAGKITYIVFDAGNRSFVAYYRHEEAIDSGWNMISNSFNFSEL